MTTLICFAIGAGAWLALLYALHLVFVRIERPRRAAGAVHRKRLNKHVLRRGWPA